MPSAADYGAALAGRTGGSGGILGTGISPSAATNIGFQAGSFLPLVGPAASIGSGIYGGIQGSRGLTSQTPSGIGGLINPANPGLFQRAGNWIGSQFADNPQLPASAGIGPNTQQFGSGMNTGAVSPYEAMGVGSSTNSTQPYTVGGQTYNLNFDPAQLNAAISDLNKLPGLGFGTSSGSASNQGGSAGSGHVGYAPGDMSWMYGFGAQTGGKYPGLRTGML